MKYNVSVWVTHDELNMDCDDDWRLYPGDDFIPAEYNQIHYCYEHHDNVNWSDILALSDSYETCPGFNDHWITLDVEPHQ